MAHWSPEDFTKLEEKPCKPVPKSRKVANGVLHVDIADWLIDPMFIAAEFQDVFMEWETISAHQNTP